MGLPEPVDDEEETATVGMSAASDEAEDDDGDRLGNLGEQRWGTHPGKKDTDGDGTPDYLESSLAAIDTDRQEPAEPSPPGKKEE